MRVHLLLLGALAVWLGTSSPPVTAAPHTLVSVDTVKVTPALDTLIINQAVVLRARVVDSVGRRKAATVTWTVRDTTAMHLRSPHRDSTGFYSTTLRAKADSGRSYVVATAGTKKDSALVIVRDTICDPTSLGSINLYPDSTTSHRTDSLGVTATPRNACGELLGGRNLTWASSDSAKATVTRLDSLVARVVVLDSGPSTVYIKAIDGTHRDSTKVKTKHAP